MKKFLAGLFGKPEPLPIANLGWRIQVLSSTGSETLLPSAIVRSADDSRRKGIIFQEFAFFLFCYVDQVAFEIFGDRKRCEILEALAKMLPVAITEALWSTCPKQVKNEHVAEFAENLRKAEDEYVQCRFEADVTPEDFIKGSDNLIVRFADNIANRLGVLEDPMKRLRIKIDIVYMVLDLLAQEPTLQELVTKVGNSALPP